VRSRQPAGENPLLLGLHTAELTGIPDEEFPLPAAMQFSGFRSVIGTMWGMDDEDGQDIAEAVYQSVLSGRAEKPTTMRGLRGRFSTLFSKKDVICLWCGG
jgi:hypothetical protein